MKSFFTTLTIIVAMVLPLTAIEAKAQTVTDINVEVYGNKVIVNYNLDKATDIDLYVSDDGGRTWEGPLKQVSGNIGKNVQPGSNSIIWDAIKERGGISGDDIRFDIRLPQMAASSPTFTQHDNELIRFKKSTINGGQYVIEYSLKEQAYAVCLYYSYDDGKTWKMAKEIDGDIFRVKPSDKRQLVWNYTKETDASATLSVKLEITDRDNLYKDYRKDINRRHFAAQNPSVYYYDNGRLLRRYHEGWFLQPEIGGFYYHNDYYYDNPISEGNGLTVNCLAGYQITRPFGIGLKIGYMADFGYYAWQSLPITLNVKGFMGKGTTCMYYSAGIGYMANLKAYQEEYFESFDYYTGDYTYRKGYQKTESSGLLLSAGIGLAIRNFSIGVEYNFTTTNYQKEYDVYENYIFDRHVSYSKKRDCHIVMLKFGYTIPFGEKR